MVTSMNDIEGKTLADGSQHNRDRMTSATECGSFHCRAVFRADEINQWIDDGLTAMCPRCGVNAVLAGITDPATLSDLHDHAFAQSSGPSAAEWNAA
jgi:hypothetical protein